eukprot:2279717-Amphidinium_carterae.1
MTKHGLKPLSDVQPSETGTKGGGNTHAETLCVDLPSSDDDETSWASLDQLGGTQLHAARGFAAMREEWDLYLDAAKHKQAVDKGVASYAATRQRALLERWQKAWAKANTYVGSGVARSTLPTGDAFLAKAWNHPDFGLYADN